MFKKFRKNLLQLVLIIFFLYFFILVFLYFYQRNLLYHPNENNYSGDKISVNIKKVKIHIRIYFPKRITYSCVSRSLLYIYILLLFLYIQRKSLDLFYTTGSQEVSSCSVPSKIIIKRSPQASE